MKTILIFNNKGGVGKTTTTINLSSEMAEHAGKAVLLIDMDPQGNLSKFFDADESKKNIAHALIGEATLPEIIQRTSYKNLDIIPANKELLTAFEMLDFEGKELILRNLLEEINGDYDYCLIDNAPALGVGTDNALVASDEVIVPICIDPFGFWGLDNIMREIEKARQENPSLYFRGCLITRYTNDEISKEATQQMQEQDVYPVFDTCIRETPKQKQAAFAKEPIVKNSTRSGAAIDYRLFAKKYIKDELC